MAETRPTSRERVINNINTFSEKVAEYVSGPGMEAYEFNPYTSHRTFKVHLICHKNFTL